MTRLIALYPRTWRDRYETEFRALMAERPPDPLDSIDVVRGAIDARMHPQVPGEPARRSSRPARLSGLLTAIGGLGWSAWIGLILRDFRGWGSGTPESANLMILISALGFLTLAVATGAIVATFASSLRPIGIPGGLFAAIGFGITAFGGGISIVIGFAGLAVLAWSMVGRVIPGWLAAGWIGTTVLAFGAFMAFVVGNGRDVGLIAWGLPFGIAWLIVGAAIAGHGSPTPADTLPDID